MCIGFSVDFSAHICYHYLTAGEDEGKPTSRMKPEDRIRHSLYALGIPIVQGAFSTLLGVAGLFFAPSYVFVTFAKMIFLVIMLGAFHGVILLPVLLSLMGPGSCSRSDESKSSLDTSGLSTPTLNAITCHKSLESQGSSCYTVNLGYVEASQFVPYQYQQYLQTYAMHLRITRLSYKISSSLQFIIMRLLLSVAPQSNHLPLHPHPRPPVLRGEAIVTMVAIIEATIAVTVASAVIANIAIIIISIMCKCIQCKVVK